MSDTVTISGNVSMANIASGTISNQNITNGAVNNNSNISGSSNASEVDGNILLYGVDKHYKHTQATPSSHWVVKHNLNKYPSIRITDTAGTVFGGEIKDLDINTLTIDFSKDYTGFCYCN